MKLKTIVFVLIGLLLGGVLAYLSFKGTTSIDDLGENLVTDIDQVSQSDEVRDGAQDNESVVAGDIVMLHNGSGPMCLQAVSFFEKNGVKYTEHLTTDEDFYEVYNQYKEEFGNSSEGVSGTFGYYPVIIAGERAFSGFDESIESELIEILGIK